MKKINFDKEEKDFKIKTSYRHNGEKIWAENRGKQRKG